MNEAHMANPIRGPWRQHYSALLRRLCKCTEHPYWNGETPLVGSVLSSHVTIQRLFSSWIGETGFSKPRAARLSQSRSCVATILTLISSFLLERILEKRGKTKVYFRKIFSNNKTTWRCHEMTGGSTCTQQTRSCATSPSGTRDCTLTPRAAILMARSGCLR